MYSESRTISILKTYEESCLHIFYHEYEYHTVQKYVAKELELWGSLPKLYIMYKFGLCKEARDIFINKILSTSDNWKLRRVKKSHLNYLKPTQEEWIKLVEHYAGFVKWVPKTSTYQEAQLFAKLSL